MYKVPGETIPAGGTIKLDVGHCLFLVQTQVDYVQVPEAYPLTMSMTLILNHFEDH